MNEFSHIIFDALVHIYEKAKRQAGHLDDDGVKVTIDTPNGYRVEITKTRE